MLMLCLGALNCSVNAFVWVPYLSHEVRVLFKSRRDVGGQYRTHEIFNEPEKDQVFADLLEWLDGHA